MVELKAVAWRYQRKEGWGDIWRVVTILPTDFETPDDWTVQPLGVLADAQSAGMGATGWHLIETAPKDGSHILVRNSHNPNIPPTTVHWFDGGWHLSVNQIGEYSEYIWGSPTHWVGLWVQGADDTDEAYEIGKRDGYEDAIQDLDLATGGDGEFFGSTIPGRTVDLPAMKARIIACCGASSLAEGDRGCGTPGCTDPNCTYGSAQAELADKLSAAIANHRAAEPHRLHLYHEEIGCLLFGHLDLIVSALRGAPSQLPSTVLGGAAK